jgi:hypothetical protein
MAPTLAVYEPGVYAPDTPFTAVQARRFAHKFKTALYNVRKMHAAGVPIGVGTDAGMTNVRHGISTQRELALLVRAGLSPAEALVAATSGSARLVKLAHDRGTIAPGQRADMLLVDGEPWKRISDITRVSRVFIDGRPVYGEGVRNADAAPYPPSIRIPPLIDDFERPDGRTARDTLRLDVFDGGVDRSFVITQIVKRGANGHMLQLAGRMAIKDNAFVGIAFPLTRGSVVPADLGGYRGLRFDLKGEGPFTVRLQGPTSRWAASVNGAADWQTVVMPFSSLKPDAPERPWDPGAIFQIEISATRPGGQTISMQLDDVTLY